MEPSPKIGDIILFTHPVERDKKGELKKNDKGEIEARVESPAIVQEVHEDGSVLCHVFSNFGGQVSRVLAKPKKDAEGKEAVLAHDDCAWQKKV